MTRRSWIAIHTDVTQKRLMAYDNVATARANIAQYFDWYNTERPHSSLDLTTPDAVYQDWLPKLAEAA